MSNNFISETSLMLFFILLTLVVYQAFVHLQKLCKKAWLNPMLLSIITLIPFLVFFNIPFEQYYQATTPLNS